VSFGSGMLKYWLSLIVLIGAAAFCLYGVIVFAWVTATPTEMAVREQARALSVVWESAFWVCVLLAVIVALRARAVWRNRRRQT
jgi:hypothetical protein